MHDFETDSPRLRFRRLRADDYAAIAPILQDAQTMYAWEHGFSYDEVCAFLADQLRRYQADGCGYFLALERESGRTVGLAGPLLEHLGANETAIGIGYIIDRARWGQGFGAECARTMLRYAREKLGAPRVVALIRPENAASLRVAAACGMNPVGQVVKHYRGKEMPHLLYTIDTAPPEAK